MISLLNLDLNKLEIVLDMMEDFYALDQYPFKRDPTRILLSEFILKPELGSAWVFQVEGKTAGYAIITWSYSFLLGGRTALLDELYFNESFRHQGLGKLAMQKLIAWSREQKAASVVLESEPHNLPAIRLYTGFGFQNSGRNLYVLNL